MVLKNELAQLECRGLCHASFGGVNIPPGSAPSAGLTREDRCRYKSGGSTGPSQAEPASTIITGGTEQMLKQTVVVIGFVLSLAVLGCGDARGAGLLDSDCVKCHPGPPADIAREGAAHRDVTCSGCHDGHPPKVLDNLPACADCHDGDSHYRKPSCSGCHANPHSPLRIVMPDDVEACRECHFMAVALIGQGGSLHSEMTCGDCHSAHRHAPDCRGCHEPHTGSKVPQGCQGCHSPHLPQPVIYRYDIADGDCGACHPSQFATLHASKTKHGPRSCVSCHQKRHGAIIACSECHGLPHRLDPTATFADCGKCHGSAHDPDPYGGTGSVERKVDVPDGLQRFIDLGKEDRFVRDLP